MDTDIDCQGNDPVDTLRSRVLHARTLFSLAAVLLFLVTSTDARLKFSREAKIDRSTTGQATVSFLSLPSRVETIVDEHGENAHNDTLIDYLSTLVKAKCQSCESFERKCENAF